MRSLPANAGLAKESVRHNEIVLLSSFPAMSEEGIGSKGSGQMNLRILLAIAMNGTLIVGCASSNGSNSRLKSPESSATIETRDQKVAVLSQDKTLVSFGKWTTNENPQIDLSYVVRAFDRDSHYQGKGVRLSVFNRLGSIVYEDYFSNISRIYSANLLRTTEIPQLVIEVNFGGNADFLQVLAYQEGKISNLANELDYFNSHAEVRPQFRSTIHPAREPYEILLTNPGLAGKDEKQTMVYRYKDGAYRLVGQFSQKRVDDFIEELMGLK